MSRRAAGKNYFLLVIRDDDNRTFSIEGPMWDDRPWNKAVVQAQEQGREVRCFNLGLENRDEFIRRETRYENTLVEPGMIVNPIHSFD